MCARMGTGVWEYREVSEQLPFFGRNGPHRQREYGMSGQIHRPVLHGCAGRIGSQKIAVFPIF